MEEQVISQMGPIDMVVGSLVVRLNEAGWGEITLDGQPQKVSEMTLRVKVGQMPEVTITRYCN